MNSFYSVPKVYFFFTYSLKSVKKIKGETCKSATNSLSYNAVLLSSAIWYNVNGSNQTICDLNEDPLHKN